MTEGSDLYYRYYFTCTWNSYVGNRSSKKDIIEEVDNIL